MTYCRTPLEPAPRGKRRKLVDGTFSSSSRLAEAEDAASDTPQEHKVAKAEPVVKKEGSEEPDRKSASPPATVKVE